MTCHDCGVQEGQLHKYDCDMERCPFCGEQLVNSVTCGCVYKILNIDCSKGSWAYSHGLTKHQEEKWLEILNKKGRVPYIIYPNICRRCGVLWPKMFMVPNAEWEKYVEIRKQGLMLCRSCYDEIKRLIESGGCR